MNQYRKRRKEERKKRLQAQKDGAERTKINTNVGAKMKVNSKEDYYQIMERFVTEKGGILFILHKGLVSKQAIARDDEKKSAVFDFNIGQGTGLSILFECEKALSDQSMSLDFLHEGVIWFGGSLDESGEKYIGSSYGDGSHSAPVTQRELVDRVNQTIDRCFEYMQKAIQEAKMVSANASNRMNGYLCNTTIGSYVRENYPEIFCEVK
jgi:hypothetical protein